MEISIKWNICRICLAEESKKSNEAYRAISEVKELPKQVYDLSGIIIKAGDSLPDKACASCIRAVRNASNLRTRCLKSNDYLKTILKRTQTATAISRPAESDNQDSEDNADEEDIRDQDYYDEEVRVINKKWSSNQRHEIKDNIVEIENNLNYDFTKPTCNEEFLPCNEENNATNLKDVTTIKKESKTSTSQDNTDMDLESCYSEEENLRSSINHLAATKNHIEIDEYHQVGDDLVEEIILPTCEEISSTSNSSLKNNSNMVLLKEATSSENSQETDSIELPDIGKVYMILNSNTIKKENMSNFSTATAIDADEPSSSNTIKIITNSEYMEEVEELQEVEVEEIEDEISQDGDKDVTEVLGDMQTLEVYDATSTISDLNEIEYLTDDLDEMNENLPDREIFEFESSSVATNPSREGSPFSETLSETKTGITAGKKQVFSRSKVVCDQCGNHFAGRSHLNYHMRTHLQPKKFECELCHKRFNAACNLNQHMRTHTGERPYECEFCHRRFTDRSTHVKHVRIHTNEKPFNCSYCGKSFSLSTTLKAHEKIHTGEKPFRCDPCGKSFKLPHHLKAHEKTYLHKFVVYREE